jgi:hypothetical protein
MANNETWKERKSGWLGMQRAWAHGLQMRAEGRLDDKELAEFDRYIASNTLNNLSMDEYAEARRNGLRDKIEEHAALEGADERDPFDVTEAREKLGKRIAADYLNETWAAQGLDDAFYLASMRQLGKTPERIKLKREDGDRKQDDNSDAVETWADNEGLELDKDGPQESESVGNTIGADFAADFRRRHGESRFARREDPADSSAGRDDGAFRTDGRGVMSSETAAAIDAYEQGGQQP